MHPPGHQKGGGQRARFYASEAIQRKIRCVRLWEWPPGH
jgi:hypothetical protein